MRHLKDLPTFFVSPRFIETIWLKTAAVKSVFDIWRSLAPATSSRQLRYASRVLI
jgi:hypothetical protein